jgi:hypothetical protein
MEDDDELTLSLEDDRLDQLDELLLTEWTHVWFAASPINVPPHR